MSKATNEVKIAEKLKFWEEQDQINKELIPRVVKNHELITDLTYQFEKSLTAIASSQADIDGLHKKIEQMKQHNSEMDLSIQDLRREVAKYESLETEVKRQEQQIQNLSKEVERGKINTLTSVGVLLAIILSFVGIIL